MKDLHINRARHEADVKRLNPEPFEYAPIDFRREKLWMAQLDRSGKIFEPTWWEFALVLFIIAMLCIGWFYAPQEGLLQINK